jgi:hypothetical protein
MGTIELDAKHNPLAWLLYFTKLTVAVDGQAQQLGWGRRQIQVAPGAHTVEISFGYMGRQRGPASINVHVGDQGVTRLRYSMPSWMFAAGRLSQV